MPTTVANFNATNIPAWLQNIVVLLGHGKPLFILLYAAGIMFFCFFYTAIVFNPEETADNLKKYGGFIPGIRPGKRTQEYLNAVLGRITLVGAVFLGLVALLPWFMRDLTESTTMVITSTGLLIVVGVVLDTMKQLEAQLLMRQYEGFIK